MTNLEWIRHYSDTSSLKSSNQSQVNQAWNHWFGKEETDLSCVRTSWRTLLLRDFSTLLQAKYSIDFFFLPLYTVWKEIQTDLETKIIGEWKSRLGITEHLPLPIASYMWYWFIVWASTRLRSDSESSQLKRRINGRCWNRSEKREKQRGKMVERERNGSFSKFKP